MKNTIMTATLLTLILCAGPARASGIDELGRELSLAARSAGLRRVAVAGLEAVGGEGGKGSSYDERLTQALVKAGKVQVVERAMIHKLMGERALSRSGAAEERAAKAALSAADGLVIGRWDKTAEGVRVTARLVSPDSGVIIAAAEALVPSDDGFAATLRVPPAPEPRSLRFESTPAEMALASDPLADLLTPAPSADCGEADSLIESVLDLKARHWVTRERKAGRELSGDPAAGAADPGLRARILARVEHWRAQRRVPKLSREEVKEFVKADGTAFSLRATCGGETRVAVRH